MVDGGGASISGLPGQEPPPPPSRAEEDGSSPSTGAGLSSPSTSARPSSLPPFLHSKNKGHLSAGEIAASTQVQDQHERPAKSLSMKVVAAPTNGKSRDPSQGPPRMCSRQDYKVKDQQLGTWKI
ncbi:uncharacterized protein LOC124675144 [Lolium rigidum]|uniref:uncharacterized protein LOC124675144 n=1 Tax=Lolium rigidum TaxID=89674 RepID=UPI001F5C6D6E|nr:uncharacterized protein LOC124675144 [Lolium rigidum]